MNSSLPLTLIVLDGTADRQRLSYIKKKDGLLPRILPHDWMTSNREDGDSAKCFSHSMEKARERLYIFFDACYLLQFSSDLQTLSTGNVANILNY